MPRQEVTIRYIDNGSRDDSAALVRRVLPWADVIELKENQGFSRAHNIGFHHCETEFVLTHDPDVEIRWPGVVQLLPAFADPTVGAVQGKLIRRYPPTPRVIDSAGIAQTLTLNGKERGANEEDQGQFAAPAYLLAVTGACGLYRLSALKAVAFREEIFDEDFFAYKEDVDLGWRLNRAGWKIKYLPIEMGIHNRTLGRRGFLSWGANPRTMYQRLANPRTRYSLRNWIWMIAKNASLGQELRHEIFVDVRLLVFFGLSLLYPPLLTVWLETAKGVPKMLAKR